MCTIGGNVAENSGGAHCLKYGFTTTHVLALEVVLPTGDLVHLGSPTLDPPGYDLAGVFVGSEGTLGVASSMTLRLVRRPETIEVLLAAFDSISAAGQSVSDIIAASILPAAMEIMDRLAIQAAEAAVHPHYPECEALLLVELDGPAAEVDLQMRQVREICKANGAWEDRLAQSEQERMLVWKGRKAAFAAAGRLSPDYIVQDGVIPRTKLPMVLEKISEMAAQVGLRVSMSSTPATETSIPWCFLTLPSPARRRWPSSCPPAYCICASTRAAPSPANMEWAGTSSKPWATCFPSPTWTPCNGCAAASTRTISPTPIRFSLAPGYAARKPASIPLILWRPQASRSTFDLPLRQFLIP